MTKMRGKTGRSIKAGGARGKNKVRARSMKAVAGMGTASLMGLTPKEHIDFFVELNAYKKQLSAEQLAAYYGGVLFMARPVALLLGNVIQQGHAITPPNLIPQLVTEGINTNVTAEVTHKH